MLVLSRKVDERIRIGDGIWLTVVKISGDKVRLGIEADRGVPIMREELINPYHAFTRTTRSPSRP